MNKCYECGQEKRPHELKVGWNNGDFCSFACDEEFHLRLFSSMPGAGYCRRLPKDIMESMERRWSQHD